MTFEMAFPLLYPAHLTSMVRSRIICTVQVSNGKAFDFPLHVQQKRFKEDSKASLPFLQALTNWVRGQGSHDRGPMKAEPKASNAWADIKKIGPCLI